MILGFSGPRTGMTGRQIHTAVNVAVEFATRIEEVHLGDCLGADKEFYGIVTALALPTCGHPPTVNALRAFCVYTREVEPREFLARNHDIVTESTHMIFTPRTEHEITRSGTWATIRYARKVGRPHAIVYPDGSIQHVGVDPGGLP